MKIFNISFQLIFLAVFIFCSCGSPKKHNLSEEYHEITGYWKEFVMTDSTKQETALRKIIVNNSGNLEQSIVFELGSQCRIWLNNDDITYKNGHLTFWNNELVGDMNPGKNTVSLSYEHTDLTFLLEKYINQDSILMLDSLEKCHFLDYTYQIPVVLDDGLKCTSLRQSRFDEEKMLGLVNRIKKGNYDDIHSLLILKDNKLVLEEYFGADGELSGQYLNSVLRKRFQSLASVTKSFTSALVGIATRLGYIGNVDIPVCTFFPEYAEILTGEKRQITIRHLLTMSAGFKWNELEVSYTNPNNDANKMDQSDDLIRYCFEKALVDPPGEKFNYNTGISVILGEIIRRSTGTDTDDFAKENLFDPLGVQTWEWSRRQNNLATGGGLSLTARDMAKFGLMYLNKGFWQGRQVVPETWVEMSLKNQVLHDSGGYGYQWWTHSFVTDVRIFQGYYAIGYGGQFIIVFPDSGLVVVSTAQNYSKGWAGKFLNMVEEEILPAVLSS